MTHELVRRTARKNALRRPFGDKHSLAAAFGDHRQQTPFEIERNLSNFVVDMNIRVIVAQDGLIERTGT